MLRFPLRSARLTAFLARTPLGLWPVRVRRGIASGARWTLFPYTSYWRGTHEPAVQQAMLALGGGSIEGWSCWDLGAHFGLYSIGLARRVGPTGEVAAFEPNPASFERLERHRCMNNLPWLKLHGCAASDHEANAELYTYGHRAAPTSHLPYTGERRSDSIGAIEVPTVRLDRLVRSGDLRPPHFVKIDVEGHGHRALAGMEETLDRVRPILIAAFHSADEVQGMMQRLTALDYSWVRISGTPGPVVGPGMDCLFTPRV